MFTDIALPEDIQADLDMRRQSVSMTKAMRLDDISRVIAEKRDEAVKERKGSGIEEVWRAAEEAYLGMDDANRHEFGKAKWAKPTTMDGPVTTEPIAMLQQLSLQVFARDLGDGHGLLSLSS